MGPQFTFQFNIFICILQLIPKLESSVETLVLNISSERQEDGRLNITSTVSEFINETIALTIFGIDLNFDDQFRDEFISNLGMVLNVKSPQSFMSLMPCEFNFLFFCK